MTEEELEKKAIEYRIELVPYTELGYPDVEIPVYSALQISEAYIAGAKEQKKNEQLKAQIEKMKCCGNCSKWYECSKEKQMLFKLHKNCDEWELAE